MSNAVYHIKSGKPYYNPQPVKIRHPDTGEWIEGIVYHNELGEKFVRERQNFIDSFDQNVVK